MLYSLLHWHITHFNKVTFFSLASFLDLALLYLLSLREPKHSHDKLSRCKSLPWILTRSWTNLSHTIPNSAGLQQNSFLSTLTLSGNCLPMVSTFSQLSRKIQDLPLLLLFPDLLPYINSSNPINFSVKFYHSSMKAMLKS